MDKIGVHCKEKLIPYSALLELTYKCNLKCYICYNTHQAKPELTKQEWFSVLEQLADLGTLHLTLSGGEIFTHRDLEPIIDKAREHHFALNLFTNATLIQPRQIHWLKSKGILEISTSLFSADPAVHDCITGISGSFEKTRNTILYLKHEGFRVRVKCLLMKYNFEGYEKLLDLCESWDVYCQMDTTLMPGSGNDLSILSERLSTQQLKHVLSTNHTPSLTGNPLAYDGTHQAKLEDSQHQLLCSAGITSLSINPYGQVYSCVQQLHPAGDLKFLSLKEIWENSPEFTKVRKTNTSDLKSCGSCQHNQYCGRCPALAEKEDGDRKGKSTLACQTSEAMEWVLKEKHF